MKSIHITASHSYTVHVGCGLLSDIGQFVENATKAKKIAIISDSNVYPLYGQSVTRALESSGFTDICTYTFPAGENSKNGQTYLDILSFLADNQLTRSDCLIALGGGVVGDITGFVAATYLRGVDYIQVPTTVLAAVDSSVGGKTAIDLPAGKNLVGAFYQPKCVVCDLNTFQTLPNAIFRDGCAEIIKYGILFDADLFQHLLDTGLAFDREYVIARCIEWKRDIVACDEFDRGERQKLNLGHTIGHGVEAAGQYAVSHGSAVAIGMGIVARACAHRGICSQNTADAIIQALQAFGLPDNTGVCAKTLFQYALSDKKRVAGNVNLIVPIAIGQCQIMPTPIDNLEEFIQAGL